MPDLGELGRRQVLSTLRSAFGDAYLQYVLNQDDLENAMAAAPPSVLQRLHAVAVRVEAAAEPMHKNLELATLAESDPDVGTSVSNALRLACGGSLPPVSEGDPLVAALAGFAIDMFPTCLLPPAEPTFAPWGYGPMMQVHRNQNAAAVSRFLVSDASLGALFPEVQPEAVTGDELFEVQCFAIWSDGPSGSLTPSMLVESLLRFVFTTLFLRDQVTADEVEQAAGEAVHVARQLVNRRQAKVPAVASLANVSVEDGLKVPLARGTVMPSEPLLGRLPFVDANATAVLCVEVELRLLDVLPAAAVREEGEVDRRFAHRTASIEAASQSKVREMDRARLTLLLSSGETIVAPVTIGHAVLNPLSGGGFSWSHEPFQAAPMPPASLSSEHLPAIDEWTQRLERHPQSLWIGSRRLLSAAAARLDPLDGFIDAVICWENLFGTGEGETTFRVCGALAVALEPNPAARKALFDQCKALYRLRSQLVHGAREPEPAEAQANRDDAVRLAIRALRAVFDRPELLDAADSTVRGRTLLLGA